MSLRSVFLLFGLSVFCSFGKAEDPCVDCKDHLKGRSESYPADLKAFEPVLKTLRCEQPLTAAVMFKSERVVKGLDAFRGELQEVLKKSLTGKQIEIPSTRVKLPKPEILKKLLKAVQLLAPGKTLQDVISIFELDKKPALMKMAACLSEEAESQFLCAQWVMMRIGKKALDWSETKYQSARWRQFQAGRKAYEIAGNIFENMQETPHPASSQKAEEEDSLWLQDYDLKFNKTNVSIDLGALTLRPSGSGFALSVPVNSYKAGGKVDFEPLFKDLSWSAEGKIKSITAFVYPVVLPDRTVVYQLSSDSIKIDHDLSTHSLKIQSGEKGVPRDLSGIVESLQNGVLKKNSDFLKEKINHFIVSNLGSVNPLLAKQQRNIQFPIVLDHVNAGTIQSSQLTRGADSLSDELDKMRGSELSTYSITKKLTEVRDYLRGMDEYIQKPEYHRFSANLWDELDSLEQKFERLKQEKSYLQALEDEKGTFSTFLREWVPFFPGEKISELQDEIAALIDKNQKIVDEIAKKTKHGAVSKGLTADVFVRLYSSGIPSEVWVQSIVCPRINKAGVDPMKNPANEKINCQPRAPKKSDFLISIDEKSINRYLKLLYDQGELKFGSSVNPHVKSLGFNNAPEIKILKGEDGKTLEIRLSAELNVETKSSFLSNKITENIAVSVGLGRTSVKDGKIDTTIVDSGVELKSLDKNSGILSQLQDTIKGQLLTALPNLLLPALVPGDKDLENKAEQASIPKSVSDKFSSLSMVPELGADGTGGCILIRGSFAEKR